jgi:membrane fusion protein (multidrug efflux system)
MSMTDSDTAPDTRRLTESNWQPTAESGDSNVKLGDKRRVPDASGDEVKEPADEKVRKKRRPLVIAIGVVIVLLLIAGGLYYWLTTRNLESTDDAFIDARPVSISSQVSGAIVDIPVTDNQLIEAGGGLAHIDDRD